MRFRSIYRNFANKRNETHGKTVLTRCLRADIPLLLRLHQEPTYQLQGAEHISHHGIPEHTERGAHQGTAHTPGRGLRPLGAHLPQRGLPRLQGPARIHARGHTPRRAHHQGPPAGLPHTHTAGGRIRGRRRHRHPGHEGRHQGRHHLHADARQGLRPAGHRQRPYLPPPARRRLRDHGPARGVREVWHTLHRGRHRPPGPHGRLGRQLPRLPRGGGEDGREAHQRVWLGGATDCTLRRDKGQVAREGGGARRGHTHVLLPGHHTPRRAHRTRHGGPATGGARRGTAHPVAHGTGDEVVCRTCAEEENHSAEASKPAARPLLRRDACRRVGTGRGHTFRNPQDHNPRL